MTLEELNSFCRNSFLEYMGIRFTSYSEGQISGELKITPNHLLPQGVVHGGVFLSLAESVAGAGSMLMVHDKGKTAFGISVNSQHLAPAQQGLLTCTGSLVFESITKHIWDLEIKDESGKLISISRVSNSIKLVKDQQAERKSRDGR